MLHPIFSIYLFIWPNHRASDDPIHDLRSAPRHTALTMASLTNPHTDRELQYIKEAEKHMKEANNRMKTSFTKWKADYLMAGPAFAKAGNSYRLAKEPKLAVSAYMTAAQCGEKSGQTFETGKYRDLAAQILAKSKDKADQVQAAELYEETMNIFMGIEDFMGGAAASKKAVAIWSKLDPAKAVTLNRDMITQLESVGRATYALEMYRGTITLACKAQRWTMAHDMIKKAIAGFIEAGRPARSVHCWHLSEIIVLAKIGDIVALDEAFMESLSTEGYGMSDEAEVAEELNRGLKDRDMERLSKAMELRGMKHTLLPCIVNLAKSMWPPIVVEKEGAATKKKAPAAQQQQKRTNAGPVKKVEPRNDMAGGGGGGEVKTVTPAAVAGAVAAVTSVADGLDGMDDLMEGLDDLLLPQADDEDDDLL